MKKIADLDKNTLGVLGLFLAVVLFFSVNIIATFTLKNYRMDLTQAKLYSLSEGSLRAVKQIKEPITIRFYLSGKLAKVSQIHATYAVRVIELLEQYASASDGKIKLEIVDPEPFSKKEDEALTYGLKGIPVGNSSEYVVTQRTLRAKEWTNISIGQLYAVNWSGISDVVGIPLRLENYVDESTLMPRQILYVDNITLTRRNSV